MAYNYAAGLYARVRALIRGAFVVMLAYVALALVLVHLFPSPIVRLFVTEERAVETAVYFLEVWTYTIVFIGALELFNAIF